MRQPQSVLLFRFLIQRRRENGEEQNCWSKEEAEDEWLIDVFLTKVSTVSCVSCFCAWKGWRDRKYFVFLNNRMQSHLLMLFFFYCGVFFRWFVFVTESSYVSSHVPILWSVRTRWASLDHFISGCHDNFQNQRFNTDGPCFRCTAN